MFKLMSDLLLDQFLEILRGKLANQNGETLMLGEAFISLVCQIISLLSFILSLPSFEYTRIC